MANVKFLRGSQANFDALKGKSAYVDGAFYVTEDTHRLYIAKSTTQADLLSQSVVTVADNAALGNQPKVEGQFYYLIKENILAIYSDGSYKQINPDTYIKDVLWEAPDTSTLNASFTNNRDDISKNVTSKAVKFVGEKGITTNVTATKEGVATIKVTGSEFAVKDEIVGDKNKVESQKYSLTQNGSAIPGSKPITLKPGSNIKFTKGEDGALTITGAAASDLSVLHDIKSEALKQGFNIAVSDQDGNHVVSLVDTKTPLDPIIQVGEDNHQIHFVNGVADLDVYSISDVDAKMKGLNAMIYKGVISNATLPNSSNQEVGFMYKIIGQALGEVPVLSGGTIEKKGTAKVGDLIIANSNRKENPEVNGLIPAENLYYDIIASGDDTDTQYAFGVLPGSAAGVKLNVTNGNTGAEVGTFTVTGGDHIEVEAGGSGLNPIATVKHAQLSTPAKGTASGSKTTVSNDFKQFTAITNVTVDGSGHVSGWQTSELEVRDSTLAQLGTFDGFKAKVTGQKVDFEHNFQVKDTSGAEVTGKDAISMTSTSLALGQADAETKTFSIDLVWGTF